MNRIRVSCSLFAFSLALVGCLAASAALAAGEPSGERTFGQVVIEPAYDDADGSIVYLQTPINAPFPTHSSLRAVAPLYLVLYPPGSSVPSNFNLNCAHNCPDHDDEVAAVGTTVMPGVYGADVRAVPGHDHLIGVGSHHGDFNVSWEVVEVLFTNRAAGNTHITTLSELNEAIATHNAITVDLGFAFHCSVVSGAGYEHGTPL